MTVAYEASYRPGLAACQPAVCLEDKYEILKDIGDGSFGSVALGRTRTAGAHIVRRGTLVAIKTMKKTFDSFSRCLELREVIFLRTLPAHPHLVPAYDIFLDPLSRKLHIVMEHMDGNLYQLMKAREHKPLDASSVRSILFQILSGLEHIHDHHFFHRDIKPENILVSTSAPDTASAFRRYSALVTPPSTPPSYSIKLADFGLARETQSRVPYTTYVSTRWYRAPEVLLRAGEYSAPVDIWAVGAMAVEVATLKPLFPGSNEVDQVWRVCEIMGSPGAWINKHGQRVGGGEWKDGVKLAQKLGFSFPKMAPHSLETILPSPQWPASLAHLVTWCLMWDPKVRPTSRQALEHEFFVDAIDPLRPKSSTTSKILGRKTSNLPSGDNESTHTLSSKTSSWFRKSLPARDPSAPPLVPVHTTPVYPVERQSMPPADTIAPPLQMAKVCAPSSKRATWANGVSSTGGAPIPILPSIRPVSPVHDEATVRAAPTQMQVEQRSQKIGRQLSVNSQGNHYAEIHRQEAERALDGHGLKSPSGSQRESFFSHLRKRARRLSGRNQLPISPNMDDAEANVGCAPWPSSNRQSIPEPQAIAPAASDPATDPGFAELDRALQSVRYSLDANAQAQISVPQKLPAKVAGNPMLKRHHSLPFVGDSNSAQVTAPAAILGNRARRSVRHVNTQTRYETPDEEDELLDEAIASVHSATRRLDQPQAKVSATRPQPTQVLSDSACTMPYLTPSHSKENNGVNFGAHEYASTNPVDIPRAVQKSSIHPQWPTPPYDENDWASSAAASIFATQEMLR